MLCIITEHKIKTKNGGIFHPLPYTELTLHLHALAPIAQWVKRWPTDLADRVRSSLEVKSSQP